MSDANNRKKRKFVRHIGTKYFIVSVLKKVKVKYGKKKTQRQNLDVTLGFSKNSKNV
jgi:hypothetical protein